ncbi:hypothetical protein [Brasilonema sp. UFV-L1]|uniref:hypothetical protein n=1 Tax=Brasilonema sp. UFV-L1 TaxID=2234130 RepID=UPI00145CF35E|nr:hypothetical protein [Brasilonema sp. UFV-L1]NMG10440.1 hypothetical protein [Brasilonema sp. UFV-L1]
MSISSVSPGDASSFTQQYLQVVEAWLSGFLEQQKKSEEILKDKKLQQVEIKVGDKVVYGMVGNKFVAALTPEIIEQLGQLQNTPVGETVSGMNNSLTLKVDDKVVLQADRDGKVIVNEYFKKDLELTREQSLPNQTNSNNSQSEKVFEQEELAELPIKVALSNQPPQQLQQEQEPNLTSISAESDSSTTPTSYENVNSGIKSVNEAVGVLPESELKTYLMTQISEMRQLHQQQLALQQRQFEELIQQRLQEQNNPNWWQSCRDTVGQLWNEFRERSRIRETAAAIKQVFTSHAVPGSNVYHAVGYTITCSGKSYQLQDDSGKSILQFQNTPFGVRLSKDSSSLEEHHKKELTVLCEQVRSGERLRGAFSPVGVKESEEFARIQKITLALSDYAKRQGKTVSIDGQFSYKWKAAPDGRVLIAAKDGRGALLAVGNGLQQCRMSERDFAYFEQILPKLEAVQSSIQSSAETKKASAKSQLSVVKNQNSYELEI